MKLSAWHYAENEKMLAELVNEGVNISEPVEIFCAFSTDSQHQAEALADLLLESGFEEAYLTDDPDGDEDNQFTVDATRTFVPALSALNAMSDLCLDIAARTGVEYEGWYVELEGADDEETDGEE